MTGDEVMKVGPGPLAVLLLLRQLKPFALSPSDVPRISFVYCNLMMFLPELLF